MQKKSDIQCNCIKERERGGERERKRAKNNETNLRASKLKPFVFTNKVSKARK